MVKNALTVLIFFGLLSRAPLFKTPFWRTPDAIEYISVARNLNCGLGLTQTVKSNFMDEAPVVTSALKGRPVMMAIILSLIIKFTSDLYILQIFSLGVGTLNACLVYLLARKFVPHSFALLAGVFAVTNPNILINSRLIISEPIFSTFLLLALLSKNIQRGLFFGLAFLTRLEAIFFLPLFFPIALIFWFFNAQVNGNPFYTYNTVHYHIKSFFDVLSTYPAVFEPPSLDFIIPKVLENLWLNLKSLFEFGYFGPLGLLIIISIFKTWKKFWYIFVFSLFTILLYASMWSAIFERARHFIPIYLLLLLPLILTIYNYRKDILVWVLVGVTLVGYLGFDIHRIVWARTEDPKLDVWSRVDKKPIYEWIMGNTGRDEIISSTNPLMLNLKTNQPGIITPTNFGEDNYQKFINQYHPQYFLVDEEKYFPFFNLRALLRKSFPGGRLYEVIY